MRTLCFNLHGLLGVRFYYRHRKYGAYLENEYCTLRTDELPADLPTLTFYLDVQPAGPPGDPDVIFEKRFLCFTFAAKIYGLHESHTVVHYRGDWSIHVLRNVQGILLQTNVVEPLVHFKLLSCEALMIHSACVSNGGQAAVMPAYGGTGKTTTAIKLVNDGYDFMGDDLVIVTATGTVFSYLRPLHLFNYVLKGLPFLTVPLATRLEIKVKNLVRGLLSLATGERFALATRAHFAQVMPQAGAAAQSELGPIVLLTREGEAIRHYDIGNDTERAEWLAAFHPTAELSQGLRLNLLRDCPEIRAEVERIEAGLIARILRVATGCCVVNCRHPENHECQELKRLLPPPR